MHSKVRSYYEVENKKAEVKQVPIVYHSPRLGLMDSARHVIGYRYTQETSFKNALDDVASTMVLSTS